MLRWAGSVIDGCNTHSEELGWSRLISHKKVVPQELTLWNATITQHQIWYHIGFFVKNLRYPARILS